MKVMRKENIIAKNQIIHTKDEKKMCCNASNIPSLLGFTTPSKPQKNFI